MPPQLPDLKAEQVVPLYDALLANADQLLTAASTVLEGGQVGLARSIGTLGLEESAKAIAIFERRVAIAYEPEGSPFVTEPLRKLWRSHPLKLQTVHRFIVDEEYWFDVDPPHHPLLDEPVEEWMATIDRWAAEDNLAKQSGFYVDVSGNGELLTPVTETDAAAVGRVLDQVHQIGWQLRLGEHIEAKSQAREADGVPPATDEEINQMRKLYASARLDVGMVERLIESAREGTPGRPLNNDEYRLHLPERGSNPFANLKKPGYEAETRELLRLAAEFDRDDAEPEQ